MHEARGAHSAGRGAAPARSGRPGARGDAHGVPGGGAQGREAAQRARGGRAGFPGAAAGRAGRPEGGLRPRGAADTGPSRPLSARCAATAAQNSNRASCARTIARCRVLTGEACLGAYAQVLMDFGSACPAHLAVANRREALAVQENAAASRGRTAPCPLLSRSCALQNCCIAWRVLLTSTGARVGRDGRQVFCIPSQGLCTAPYRAPELWDVPSFCSIDFRAADIWCAAAALLLPHL